MPDILVVKIGGSTLGARDTALEDVVALQRRGLRPVVGHGGGAPISEWLEGGGGAGGRGGPAQQPPAPPLPARGRHRRRPVRSRRRPAQGEAVRREAGL